MTLTSGTKRGAYEIIGSIGAGGMGEVYRARDTLLGREVAVKVLPEAFARDAERMARFRREAQVLAALNHPNIAAIYGFEDSDPTHALVMELVEGPTLAERIKQGAIAFDEALPMAKQICEALEYAHEHGIVHRDLKPANIKITNNDTVKILDFGLAKALEGDAASANISSSPTITHMATQAGMFLGTAAYMSPEQAKGKAVDRRTDIWAFGCVLYEMLTAKMAFSGETVTDTLAAVIKTEPDWSAVPANTPQTVRNLLQRCLKKDARQRLQSIGDARIVFEEILSGGVTEYEPLPESGATRLPLRKAWRTALPWALAAVMTVLAAGIAYFYSTSRSAGPDAVRRLDISLPDGVSVVTRDSLILSISPDGRQVVFMATKGDVSQLYRRSMDEADTKPIAGTENGVSPFFSPDGRWIGFFADGKLKKISADGGAPVALWDTPNQRGGTWAPDGTIIFSPDYTAGLMRISESGGQPQQIITPDAAKGERTYRWPDALPGGKGVLFTIGMANSAASYDDAEIAVYSFATKKIRMLTHGGMAIYSPAGYLLYYRAGALLAAPFSESRMEITGPSVQVPETVGNDPTSGAAYFAVASDGAMSYLRGRSDTGGRLIAVADAKGDAHVLPLPPRGYSIPRFSPDGRRLALTINAKDNGIVSGLGDLWLYDFASENLSRLTFDEDNDYAVWSADGSRIFFNSSRGVRGGGLYAKRADGTGGEQPLLTDYGGSFLDPDAVSPDGQTIVSTRTGGTGGDLMTIALAEHSAPKLFKTNAEGAVLSPDGNYVAYSSYQAGKYQLFVNTFPDPTQGQWQITVDHGIYPKWCKEGRELLYYDQPVNRMMAVDVDLKPSFHAGRPRVLFNLTAAQFSPMQTNPAVNYDVSSDCQRFVFMESSVPTQAAPQVAVTLGFPAEIRALVGNRK